MASYIDNPNKLDWAMPFQRTGTFPLDRSSMFSSFADATLYAKGDTSDPDSRGLCGTSYVGQPIVVFENDAVDLYVIQEDRSLKKAGSNLVIDVDNASLVFKSTGETEVFAIKGFDTATEGQTIRIKNVGNATNPSFEIEWVKLSTSDITGLDTAISGATSSISDINQHISQIETEIGTEATDATQSTGIYSKIDAKATKATTLAGYGITDAYTKTEVDGKLTGALHYQGTKDSFTALTGDSSYTPQTGDVWNIRDAGGTDAEGIAIKAGDNVIYNGTGWDVSSGTVDLSVYYNKTEIDSKLSTKVDDPEDGSRLITVDEVNKLDASSSVSASAINGSININGADVSVYRLPEAGDDLGGIKDAPDNTTLVNPVAVTAGVGNVPSIDGTTVTGIVNEASGISFDGERITTEDFLTDRGTAKAATKVTSALNIGSKKFDGSSSVTINSTDIPLPADVVKNTDYSNSATGGVVISSTADNNVAVNSATGIMTVNNITGDKISGAVEEASKVSHTLKAGDKTFDGSAAVTITAEDLGAATTTDLEGYTPTTQVANNTTTGLVKGSSSNERIYVFTDGTMTVNSVSGGKVYGAVASATNVTTNINGHTISSIFETDGVTVKSATKLNSEVDINLTGAISGKTTFDGSANANITTSLEEVGTAGTYTKVTTDANGRVIAGTSLNKTDLPALDTDDISGLGSMALKNSIARTDITTAFEANIAALENASHTHSNMNTLNGITSSKVSTWDQAVTNLSSKADKSTTLGGYGITDAYTKTEINGKLTGALHYKGTIASLAALETSMAGNNNPYVPEVGDVWNISTGGGTDFQGVTIKDGDNLIRNENNGWDVSSGTVDLSQYYTKTETDAALLLKANQTTVNSLSSSLDDVSSKVGGNDSGLIKEVNALKTTTSTNASNISTLDDAINNGTTGINTKLNAVATNITKLEGASTVSGSVRNLIASSEATTNASITSITRTNGTIDTKIATHNTASAAHSALFNAKQNKIIGTSIELNPDDFLQYPGSYGYAYEYEYYILISVESLGIGASSTRDYIPLIMPIVNNEAILRKARFSSSVIYEDGNIVMACQQKPTGIITVIVNLIETDYNLTL